ncbi:protein starmaker-like [Condylostylus longicornis]|uniref:protein starmaker-like n=1 Tax=Condylostylus longicornis TaxID=2530218 RepID=UPI00244DC377|nr:protein starmaker-like [Condylostylus longicornis]
MFKIIILSILIICTFGAPTEKSDQPALLLKSDSHKDDKEIKSATLPVNERKYGEHVAKRDTNTDKSDAKSTNDNSAPKVKETKELPAEQKPKRETHNLQSHPAESVSSHEEKKEPSSEKPKAKTLSEEKKNKREAPKPQTLPATDVKSELNPESVSNQPEHNKAPKPAVLPASAHQHKRENPQHLPAKETENIGTKSDSDNSKSTVVIKDSESNNKNNAHKRDIPVSLVPSTSPKSEVNEAKKSDAKSSSEEKDSKNDSQHRPLPTYTKPVPVADLFKQH